MADADLDVIIRQLAKQAHKSLTSAAKRRRDHYLGLAAKAKTPEAKDRFKQLARVALEEGSSAAKRLQMSADNTADSYARALRKAAEAPLVKSPAAKKESATKATTKPTADAAPKPAKTHLLGKTASSGKAASPKKKPAAKTAAGAKAAVGKKPAAGKTAPARKTSAKKARN